MSTIQLSLLGGLSISVHGQTLTRFPTDKTQSLLAYLALETNQPHSREVLAALFWPDASTRQAAGNLRTTLHRLRRTLDGLAAGTSDQLLVATRDKIHLKLAHATVDALEFQAKVRWLASHEHPTLVNCASCMVHLLEAADLYKGELLRGLSLPDAQAFEEWLLLRREHLHHQALRVLSDLAAVLESREQLEQAQAVAVRLLELDPYREAAHRQLMRLLARQGMANQALARYDGLRKLLREELGVEPDGETTDLVRQISAGAFDQTRGQVASRVVPSPLPRIDWSEAPVVGTLFGRSQESSLLRRWLIEDRCQVVALLGVGGVGKSTLAAHAARALSGQFDVVLWRSLLNAPPLEELLSLVLQGLAGPALLDLPDGLDGKLSMLLNHLRQWRCLLVLDNVETILQQAEAGRLHPGYEAYGQLFHILGTQEHRSCLLLTSRERPLGIARLERESVRVRSLQLVGLDIDAGQDLLRAQGLAVSQPAAAALIQHYSGNPMALSLVAQAIEEIYQGDVDGFLADELPIFDDIRDVLDQQIGRLPPLEHDILTWLAIARVALTLADLQANMIAAERPQGLLQALRALQRRSLLEKSGQGFTLLNVLTEYLTDHLVEQVCREIESGQVDYLNRFALLHAQEQEYVRLSQVRVILNAIAGRLRAVMGEDAIAVACRRMLDNLRQAGPRQPGYAAGNLLNLLLHMGIDVAGYDLSCLSVWQAYLQGHLLQAVDFSQADLDRSVFTETFGLVWAVAYSPDGQHVAAGSADGKIQVWRADTGQLLASWRAHVGSVYSLAFSQDGTMLASGGADGIVFLWDTSPEFLLGKFSELRSGVTTGRLLGALEGHEAAVEQVVFSPAPTTESNGWVLASASDDLTIRLWHVRTRQTLRILRGHTDFVIAAAFSPDGRWLASGSRGQVDREPSVHLWDVQSGQLLRVLKQAGWVNAVAFSPEGSLLASGSQDGLVQLWDVAVILQEDASFTVSASVLGRHSGGVQWVAFSPDGQTLASGGHDRMVRLWDLATRQQRLILAGHTGWVRAVAFHPDGQILASAGWDRSVRIWDSQTGRALRTFQGGAISVFGVTFSPDGKRLASATSDGVVRLWDVKRGRVSDSLPGHTDWVWRVAFGPDGETLASASMDHTVRVYDVQSGQLRTILREHTAGAHGLAFSPDGRLLASTCLDGTLLLTNLAVLQGHEAGDLHMRLKGYAEWCLSATFSPDSQLLASSGANQLVVLWDVGRGTVHRILRGHSYGVQEVAFSPDGSLLASASWDRTVRLWDVATGQVHQVLEGHADIAQGVAFSPDGQSLASSSYDGTVRLWDVASGQAIHVLAGHTNWVHYVAFSPDGRLLASGSADQTIRLWDPATGACLQTWRIPGPYEGMNISGVTGITEAQRASLRALGASLRALGAVDRG